MDSKRVFHVPFRYVCMYEQVGARATNNKSTNAFMLLSNRPQTKRDHDP